MKDKLGAAAACLLFAVSFGAVGVFASWVIGNTIYDGYRAKEWVLVKATVDGTVFVNPDNPAESMIDRSIRWKLLVFFLPFSLAFGGVGVGAMWMLYRTLSPALSQGRGRTAGSGLGGLWVFTFFWNVISFPIAFLFVPQIIEDGEWMGLLVLLFPLIGVLMLWGALAGTYRYLRYGYVQPPVTLSLSLSQGRGRTSSKMVETMEQFSGMRGVETAAGIARHINVRHLVIGMVVLYVVWQVGTIVFAIVRSFE